MSSGSDYTGVAYDVNGNVVLARLRDGQLASFGYDALDRVTARTPGTGAPQTLYSYDLLGLPSRGSVPNAYYNVTVAPNVPVVGPSTVAPANGQPGGGVEYVFPKGTPPGSVGPPNPIPTC